MFIKFQIKIFDYINCGNKNKYLHNFSLNAMMAIRHKKNKSKSVDVNINSQREIIRLFPASIAKIGKVRY